MRFFFSFLFFIAVQISFLYAKDIAGPTVSKELVSTLEDDKKRSELIEKLKTLSEAEESLHPSHVSTIHDLNAKLVSYVELSAQTIYSAAQTLANFPSSLWKTLHNIKNYEVQDKLLDFVLVLFFAFTLGFLLEFILRVILRRVTVPPSPPVQLWRFTGYLVLTIIPILAFSIASSFIAYFLEKPYILDEVFVVISALFVVRMLLKYFKILLQPHQKYLRIIPLSDRSSLRFYRLVSVFTQILILGTILGQFLKIFGLPQEQYQAFKGVVAFGLLLTLATLVLDYKRPIARWLRQDDLHFQGTPRILLSITHVIARTWHMLTIGLLLALYIAWLHRELDRIIYLGRSIGLTILLLICFRFLNQKLSFFGHKWSEQLQGILGQTDEDIEYVKSWKHSRSVPVLQSAYFLVPLGQFSLYLATVILGLQIWGIDLIKLFTNPTVQEHLLSVVSIILVALFVRILWGLVDMVATAQLNTQTIRGEVVEPSLFAKTIVPILRSSLKAVVSFIGFLIILSELDIDVKPVLYAFSVASLAISFGAQTMVKDLITGFLTLFEGNIAVGEQVTIGSHTGVVEAISLRSVFIRHRDGSLQSIPFSEVQHIINKSRDYCMDFFEVATTQETPIERVFAVLEQTYDEMRQISPWNDMITDPIVICGVDRFSDTSMIVMAKLKSKPDARDVLARAFKAKLQDNLRLAGIKPPMQQQIVYNVDYPITGKHHVTEIA